MRKQQRHYLCFEQVQRGSALVGSLVMIAILALAVAVMLSSSNTAIQQSKDRILYEEAYQAAISGTHIARAWMINPEIADDMKPGSGIETDLSSIIAKAKAMNEKIIADKYNPSSTLYGTSRFEAAGIPLGATLTDGRRVIYEFPSTKPIVSFANNKGQAQFTENLFQEEPENGHTNYVDRLRITTPGTTNETSCSLREATFIIESRGVTEYAGEKKERVVLQRVLVYPNEPSSPLLSAGAAIITQGGFSIQGKSHANIHWGPVLAKGNIALDFLTGPAKTATKPQVTWSLGTITGKGNEKKHNSAGLNTYDKHQGFDSQQVDKWLKWQAGSEGQLIGSDGNNLFANIVAPKDDTNNTIPIVDFFAQLHDGLFNDATNGLNKNNLTLAGQFPDSGTTMNNPNGLFELDGSGQMIGKGALVQYDPTVDQYVDNFFADMSYEKLKEYAKQHNGYYVYENGKFTPSTPPDMNSMVSGTFDPLAENAIADRILFIDTPNDNVNDPQDLVPNPPLNGNIPIPNFWKGIMYVNGNISEQGGNRPDLVVRTPEQFKQYRQSGSSNSYTLKKVMMDGILICAGEANLGGNATIYGTLAAKKGVGVGGTPSIFYNPANEEGRLKDDTGSLAEFRIIAGRLVETNPNI